jgi:hypothetical protein
MWEFQSFFITLLGAAFSSANFGCGPAAAGGKIL